MDEKRTKRGPILSVPVTKTGRGRPSLYTEKLAADICSRIERGETVYTICLTDGMPDESTLYRWLATHHDFRDQYARAREESAHRSADKILEIAKKVEEGELEPDVGRVVMDAHKWSAGKRKPKVYGDRQTVDVGDDTLRQLSDDRVKSRLAQLLGKAGAAGSDDGGAASGGAAPSNKVPAVSKTG